MAVDGWIFSVIFISKIVMYYGFFLNSILYFDAMKWENETMWKWENKEMRRWKTEKLRKRRWVNVKVRKWEMRR